MKHKIINSEYEIYFDNYEDEKEHIKIFNAEQIGRYVLEEGFIETKLNRTSDYESDKIRIRSELVVMKSCDYYKMMEYLDLIEDYMFYDKETGENVMLKDLI